MAVKPEKKKKCLESPLTILVAGGLWCLSLYCCKGRAASNSKYARSRRQGNKFLITEDTKTS
jgi:hypothetical protein